MEQFAKKALEAGTVELDENQIKIMILKLQQIEKLLKEVGKNKKKKTAGGEEDAPSKTKARRASASSTLQAFQNSFKKTGAAINLNSVQEHYDSEGSDGAALLSRADPRNSTAQRRSSGFAGKMPIKSALKSK